MAETCPKLESVTFSGWKSFTSDDLLLMAEQLSSLRRIDLSSINVSQIEFSSVSGSHTLILDTFYRLRLATNRR